MISVIGTIMISVVALVLNKLNFGSLIKLDQVLYITVAPGAVKQEYLEVILRGLFKELSVININFNSSNKTLFFSYNVRLSKKNDHAAAMAKIISVKGVLSAELLASQQIVEF